MKVGDLVTYGACLPMSDEECQSSWGLGIILVRNWNDSASIWESIVWFSDIRQEVLCDDCDLKKVA